MTSYLIQLFCTQLQKECKNSTNLKYFITKSVTKCKISPKHKIKHYETVNLDRHVKFIGD